MRPERALELTLPARATSVPRARRAVAAYAARIGLLPERIEDLCLVVSEAVTNVVLHAYAGEEGSVYLTAGRAGDDLWVLVEDHGLGLRSGTESPGLGLGLGLIERFADEFAIGRPVGGGTLLRIRFALAGVRDRAVGPGAHGFTVAESNGGRPADARPRPSELAAAARL